MRECEMTNTESTIITAKFSGRCVKCGNFIPSGVRCKWIKNVGICHIEGCSAPVIKDNAPSGNIALDTHTLRPDNKKVTVTMGVFRKGVRIYVVKPNRDKTRVYAKEIIESPARMTESGEKVDFESIYRPGVVFDLTENDRWDLADAKDFLTKYAKCIVCNRSLKAAKSVEQLIGPVCAKYFANRNGCDHGNHIAS